MPQDPDLEALLQQFGAVPVSEAAPTTRPIDPRTGQPVMTPGEPGYVVPGSEADPMMATPRRTGAQLETDALLGFGSALNPVSMAKGAYSAVRHPIDTVSGIVNGQVDQGRRALALFRQSDLTSSAGRRNLSEGVGRGMAALLPVLGPAAARLGDEVGSGDPQRMAHGVGEAAGMILGPAAVKGAVSRLTPVARSGAERLASMTMRPGDDLLAQTGAATPAAARTAMARTALDEGVTPGLVTSGADKAKTALDRALADADAVVAGPAGDAPINLRRVIGPNVRAAQDRVSLRFDNGPARDAANRAALSIRDHPRLVKENARELSRVAGGNVAAVRRSHGAGPDVTRAMGRDARAEVARAVPASAAANARIDRLEPVAEAYARMTGEPVEIPGLPTISARILLSGANRVVGPAAQGLNRVSKMSPQASKEMAKMAVLLDLLGQQPRP